MKTWKAWIIIRPLRQADIYSPVRHPEPPSWPFQYSRLASKKFTRTGVASRFRNLSVQFNPYKLFLRGADIEIFNSGVEVGSMSMSLRLTTWKEACSWMSFQSKCHSGFFVLFITCFIYISCLGPSFFLCEPSQQGGIADWLPNIGEPF